MKTIKLIGIIVMVLGILGIGIGGAFFGIGVSKNNLIVDRMNTEKVSLNIDPTHPDVFTKINNAADAQKAADTIASHRRMIAPTYQDLLAGGKFDSTNATQLTYAQAMNLENYLYMAVTAFGLIQVAEATGGFMILAGVALLAAGFGLYRLSKTKTSLA
jgi:hypothetical protein